MNLGLFNELYSCYYSTVYHILKNVGNKDLDYKSLCELVLEVTDTYGFSEISNSIVTRAIKNGMIISETNNGKNGTDDNTDIAWPLFEKQEEGESLRSDSKVSCKLNGIKYFPLSNYEKMWLKSIFSDPRVRLFIGDNGEPEELKDVVPLYDWNDFVLFDRYSEGDPYTDTQYIKIFHTILNAIHNQSRLKIVLHIPQYSIDNLDSELNSDSYKEKTVYIDPDHLEYSERDDRFQLIGNNPRFGRNMVNIKDIFSCEEVKNIIFNENDTKRNIQDDHKKYQKEVLFRISDKNDSLERFMFTFSHYDKVIEDSTEDYRVRMIYDETDEADVVIRVLSFGSNIYVVEPTDFCELIRDKLKKQIRLDGGIF